MESITESQNSLAWKGPYRSPGCNTPATGRDIFHSFSGQPIQVLHCPHSKELLPNISLNLPFPSVPITLSPITTVPDRESLCGFPVGPLDNGRLLWDLKSPSFLSLLCLGRGYGHDRSSSHHLWAHSWPKTWQETGQVRLQAGTGTVIRLRQV